MTQNHSVIANKSRGLLALSSLVLAVLSGCEQQPQSTAAGDAQTQQKSTSDTPVLSELRRVGSALASQSGDLDLTFVDARNGTNSAGADDGFDWSVFYLSFATEVPSALQMSGNPHSQTLSPENQVRQERWQTHVCTAELNAVMNEHNIDVIYATFGKADMPVAQCQRK